MWSRWNLTVKELIFQTQAPITEFRLANYLAAGSCNFNNSGVSLWPLDQIVNDTQYYVRDAVIDYITYMGTVSPAIEERLNFLTLDQDIYMPFIMR